MANRFLRNLVALQSASTTMSIVGSSYYDELYGSQRGASLASLTAPPLSYARSHFAAASTGSHAARSTHPNPGPDTGLGSLAACRVAPGPYTHPAPPGPGFQPGPAPERFPVPAPSNLVQICIYDPNNRRSFLLHVDLSEPVCWVKRKISVCPGGRTPQPCDQILVHEGCVLRCGSRSLASYGVQAGSCLQLYWSCAGVCRFL